MPSTQEVLKAASVQDILQELQRRGIFVDLARGVVESGVGNTSAKVRFITLPPSLLSSLSLSPVSMWLFIDHAGRYVCM